ncbi:MAG: AI-2E family transporter [Actinomycetia bacterium]|nr:AI-2E family transporter [Actinomycetes bacterium]
MSWIDERPRLRAVLVASLTIVLVGAAAYVLGVGLGLASNVIVPAALGILFVGLLVPIQVFFNHRLGLNRHLSAGASLVVTIASVLALLWYAGDQIVRGVAELIDTTAVELDTVRDWIEDSELPIGAEIIDDGIASAQEFLQGRGGDIAAGALEFGYTAGSVLFAGFLTLVATFLLLAQGDRIFSWFVGLAPQERRSTIYESGRRAWVTVGTYARMQVVIAAADAIGIGLGAWVLGLPFVVPIVALTFILCFVPIIGAIISGAIVVLVALAFEGFWTAVIMLVIVVAVQQVESDVLSPVLMGKAVDVHPLAVLLGVAGAVYTLGLVGALFAVPVLAMINTVAKYLTGRDPFPVLDSGGSALTDSPRKLVGDKEKKKPPERLGEATPAWMAADRDRDREESLRAAAGYHENAEEFREREEEQEGSAKAE